MNAGDRFWQFFDGRKRNAESVSEDDGPFKYRYTAISRISGAHFPKKASDPFEIARFAEFGAKAYLSENWELCYDAIDTGNAIATMMLRGAFGVGRKSWPHTQWLRFLRWLLGPEWMFRRNLAATKLEVRAGRLKQHSGSGCALIYVAEKSVDDGLRLDASRKIGNTGYAIDAIEKGAIGKLHQANVRGLSTAVSIAMTDTNGSPDVQFLSQGIQLIGRDGLVIYPRTIEAGGVGVVVSGPPPDEIFDHVGRHAKLLAGDRRLSVAASLFTLSQHRDKDNLRAFMAAWSALEFLTNTLEKRVRSSFWEGVADGSITPPEWDIDLTELELSDYRLKDVFYVMASHLNPKSAETDIAEFASINKKRGDYYHRLEIDEKDLPTRQTQNLFRTYLRIVLSTGVALDSVSDT